MFRSFLITIAFLQLGGIAASSVLQEDPVEHDKFMVQPAQEEEDRELLQSVPCPHAGGGPINYFQLTIDFIAQGGADTSACEESQKKELGEDINRLLLDYGMGEAGAEDDIVHLAEVCVEPENIALRRKLRRLGYTYRGGGSCRYCGGDNGDGGRSLQLYDPNWFENIYAPELENTLRNAITNTVARKHKICLGNGPQVLVGVTPVNADEVNTSC